MSLKSLAVTAAVALLAVAIANRVSPLKAIVYG